MTLGDIIRKYRMEHGRMSQRDFAKLCGGAITCGYISMLENNYNPRTGKPISPSIATYEAVAKVVGIELNDLLDMVKDEGWISTKQVSDDEMYILREQLRRRPGMRVLFDACKDASDDDLLRAVKIIEALKGK